MSLTTITAVGAFSQDVVDQINANFTAGTGGSLASPTITGTVAGGATYTSITLTTPVLGVATGTSVNLSGDCKAATFHAGSTAGVTAGPFTTVSSIATTAGLVTTLTGS
jgi:hypothetical protein